MNSVREMWSSVTGVLSGTMLQKGNRVCSVCVLGRVDGGGPGGVVNDFFRSALFFP